MMKDLKAMLAKMNRECEQLRATQRDKDKEIDQLKEEATQKDQIIRNQERKIMNLAK